MAQSGLCQAAELFFIEAGVSQMLGKGTRIEVLLEPRVERGKTDLGKCTRLERPKGRNLSRSSRPLSWAVSRAR